MKDYMLMYWLWYDRADDTNRFYIFLATIVIPFFLLMLFTNELVGIIWIVFMMLSREHARKVNAI